VKKHLAQLAAILAIFLASLCSAQQPLAPGLQHSASSANAHAELLPNLDIVKGELRQYHDCTCKCGCYARDIDVQADRAIAFLHRRAAHPRPQEKLAMVLDIDETSLSNYPEMLKADFTYESKAFDEWVQSAQGPAMQGTLRLYREAQSLGVSVFFITGRPESERAATVRNLQAQGFHNWQQLVLHPADQPSLKTVAYKSGARAQIVAQGYTLVLSVGDQWSDQKGAPEAEFFVKYPNPYYFIP